eukprot:g1146.t1
MRSHSPMHCFRPFLLMCWSISRATNLVSIDELADPPLQPTDQATDQSANQPAHQPADQATYPPADPPAHPPADQPTGPLIPDQPAGPSAVTSADPPAGPAGSDLDTMIPSSPFWERSFKALNGRANPPDGSNRRKKGNVAGPAGYSQSDTTLRPLFRFGGSVKFFTIFF